MKVLKEIQRVDKKETNFVDTVIDCIFKIAEPATKVARINAIRAVENYFNESLIEEIDTGNPRIHLLDVTKHTPETKRIQLEDTYQWRGTPISIAIDRFRLSDFHRHVPNYKLSGISQILFKADLKRDRLYIIRFYNGNHPEDATDLTGCAPVETIKKELSSSHYIKELY